MPARVLNQSVYPYTISDSNYTPKIYYIWNWKYLHVIYFKAKKCVINENYFIYWEMGIIFTFVSINIV